MRKIMAITICSPFVATKGSEAAIREMPVTYKGGETTMKGVVVYDDAAQCKRPGIILVHEWWGITQHTRDEAYTKSHEV